MFNIINTGRLRLSVLGPSVNTQVSSKSNKLQNVFSTNLLVCVLLLAVSLSAQATQQFDIYHLDHSETGSENWTIRNFTGGEYRDILYVNSTRENERSASLYSLSPSENGEESWQLAHHWQFDEDVVGIDTVRTSDGIRLLIIRVDNYYLLDLETMEEELAVSLPSIYRTAPYATMPQMNLGMDLNGDDLSDLAIPDFDGYWIVHQLEEGTFGEVQKLPVKAGLVTGGLAWSYRPRQIYRLDFDGDGTRDICFWDRGEFIVYFGSEEGYSTESLKAELDLNLDVDENVIADFAFGESKDDDEDSEDGFFSRTLERLTKLNDDDVIDAIVTEVSQKGIFDFRITYTIHLGIIEDGRTIFKPEPDGYIGGGSMIQIERVTDINNDGNADIVTSGTKISIGAIIRILLTWSFSYRTDFYLMNDGQFQSEPDLTRRTRIKINLSERDVQGLHQFVIGDLNDDSRDELVVATWGSEELKIYYGIDGPNLFEKAPEIVELGFVFKGDLSIQELNDDDLEDIMVERDKGITYIISR